MNITSLHLTGYRNLEDMVIAPYNGCNVIIGNNAQGKTNLLEAIYLCAFGKSHRIKQDEGLINFNKDFATVKCYFTKEELHRNITVHLNKKEKKIIVDNKAIKKRSELIGQLNCVMFCPDDLNLVKGSPGDRRKFMDKCLSQIYPKYFEALSKYFELLKYRNAELKNGGKLLDLYNENISILGALINRYRIRYIEDINKIAKTVHKGLISNENILLTYTSDLTDKDVYLKELEKVYQKELRYQATQIGPHKEDVVIDINSTNAKMYASQGQQRSIALSLKISELNYIKNIIGETPILLLDDVMSELDKTRQQKLIKQIEGIQSFITTTHLDFSHCGDIYTMIKGNIT